MKTKNLFKIIMTIIIGLSLSCSKSTDKNSIVLPTIQTSNAENISGVNVTLGGNITSDGGGNINRKGVCWGLSTNPTIGTNNNIDANNNSVGSYTMDLINRLDPNTVYYARAYCENAAGLQYGNTISFTTGQFISNINPTDILTTKVKFRGQINQPSNSSKNVGFVYSTNPNPNVNNSSISAGSITGSSTFDVSIQGLNPNTTYYVRVYTANPNGGYYYSDEKSFKTVGYFGPAGGYVAYDKGEITNGWRYLEIHPTTLSYNISWTSGGAWGDDTFLSGTSDLFGKGQENTTFIVNNTTSNNCAAKLCNNLVLNGYSDWFLPSSNELLTIANSLLDANIILRYYSWTSTQFSAGAAYSLEFESAFPKHFYLYNGYSKSASNNLNILPVRRY
jgi:hypothetical protein